LGAAAGSAVDRRATISMMAETRSRPEVVHQRLQVKGPGPAHETRARAPPPRSGWARRRARTRRARVSASPPPPRQPVARAQAAARPRARRARLVVGRDEEARIGTAGSTARPPAAPAATARLAATSSVDRRSTASCGPDNTLQLRGAPRQPFTSFRLFSCGGPEMPPHSPRPRNPLGIYFRG